MRSIVISQPFLFPWIGLFEQLRLADIFIHYDDVQFSKGGFMNRVQIKTQNNFKWLSIPVNNFKLGKNINEIVINDKSLWRQSHYDFLKQVFNKSPYIDEMLPIVYKVYWELPYNNLADLTINSIEQVAKYYSLDINTTFYRSSTLGITGKSSQRVLNIVKYFKSTNYITGLGALKYFDFNLFDTNNISVRFLNYKKVPYKQLYGKFNPFVSILDLIANEGKNGIKYICSNSMYWKDFIKTDNAEDYLKNLK